MMSEELGFYWKKKKQANKEKPWGLCCQVPSAPTQFP